MSTVWYTACKMVPRDPHYVASSPLWNPFPWSVGGTSGLLLTNRIWQEWWDVSLRLGYKIALAAVLLTLSCSQAPLLWWNSCCVVNCPKERRAMELRETSTSRLKGPESCQHPLEWPWKWILSKLSLEMVQTPWLQPYEKSWVRGSSSATAHRLLTHTVRYYVCCSKLLSCGVKQP